MLALRHFVLYGIINGDQAEGYDAVVNEAMILGQRPAFHLHAGDISYAGGGSGLITDTFDPRLWDQCFNQLDQVSSEVPWMVAMGNHDMEPLYSPDGYGGNIKRFAFPGNGPKNCPVVFSFIYGNVGVLSLDANDVSYDTPANYGYSGGAQTAWLARRLEFLRQQPDVDFIVAYFHYCAYSTCTSHYSDQDGVCRHHLRHARSADGHLVPQPLRGLRLPGRRRGPGEARREDHDDRPGGHRTGRRARPGDP
jgi:Calcineurin-like phosphoesterase